MREVKVVLDSNIFLLAFRGVDDCMSVLKSAGIVFSCFIPELVVDEIFERLKFLGGKDFASFVRDSILNMELQVVDESIMPDKLIEKYITLGLKPADACIAAFTEYGGAGYLVSENRHFLQGMLTSKFMVLNSRRFLEELEGEH